MKQQLQSVQSELNSRQHTIEQYAELVIELKAEVMQLQNIVSDQANLIEDLQCQADPYSCDGSAICNIFYE